MRNRRFGLTIALLAAAVLASGAARSQNVRILQDAPLDEVVTPDNYRTQVYSGTIEVWVVQQGYGTLVTGGERTADGHSGAMSASSALVT